MLDEPVERVGDEFDAVGETFGRIMCAQSMTMLTTPMIASLMVSHADLNAVIAPFSSSLE